MTTRATPAERNAQRFFWCWLIVATATSIAGNVAHALLTAAHAPAGSTINPIVAGALAVVPPIVQVGATHGVHVLVNARITGAAYNTALAVTVALVVFAFILSFQALRELAVVYAGMNHLIACLVPLVIDLSITGSTVSILALTRAHRDATLDAQAHEPPIATWTAETTEVAEPTPAPSPGESNPGIAEKAEIAAEPADIDDVEHVELNDEARWTEESDWADEAEQAELIPVSPFASASTIENGGSTGPVEPWVDELPNAEQIVHEGGTRLGRVKVAQILHAHRQGTPPATIARELDAGFRTVKSIIAKAEAGEAIPA